MTSVAELELPEFDPLAPDVTGETYHQRLAEVRKQGWLARSPLSLVVLDRDGGEFFLRSKATVFPGREIADLFGVTGGRLREQIDANILNQTGARHRRLRALVGPSFSPRAADKWRPVMRGFLADLWQGIGHGHGHRVRRRVRQALPVADDRRRARRARAGRGPAARVVGLGAAAVRHPRRCPASWRGSSRPPRRATTTSRRCSQRRAAEPADDLISALLAAEAEGDRLSHPECVNLVMNVIAGGIDTTQSQLSHALRLFACHPDQWALLASQPELVPQAVSEVLRFEPITPFTARLCTEDVEYRGLVFPAGTIVAVCAERANREPAEDGAGQDAERFDITVDHADRLLTFGAGPHFCLGSNLARAELEEALTFLAPRMPGLALDGPPALGGVEGIYGIDALPLSWS